MSQTKQYIFKMDVALKIGIIRNLFLTVSDGIFIAGLVSPELLLLHVYRRPYSTIQGTIQNLEVSSDIKRLVGLEERW